MKKILFFILLLCLVRMATAEYQIKNGMGFPILSSSLGLRAESMGGAFTGLANDISAVQYNPAGLGTLYNKQLLLTHDIGLAGINTEYLSYTAQAWGGNIAYSLLYHHTDPVEEIANGTLTGVSFSLSDLAAIFSYGRHVWKWFYYGMNLRYARLNRLDESYNAGTFDFGVLFIYDLEQYIPNLHYSGLGFSVMNLFPAFNYPNRISSMDTKFRIGTGFSYRQIMSLTMDFENSRDKSPSFRVGYEIFPLYFLALRAGYVANDFSQTFTDNFTFGAGLGNKLREGTLSIDFSARMKKSTGFLYKLGLHWIFDKPYHFTTIEDKISREKKILAEIETKQRLRQEAKQRKLEAAQERIRQKEEAERKRLLEIEQSKRKDTNVETLPSVESPQVPEKEQLDATQSTNPAIPPAMGTNQ
jgi:hypothetical protein